MSQMQGRQEAPGLMLWVQRKERTALNEEERAERRAEFEQEAESRKLSFSKKKKKKKKNQETAFSILKSKKQEHKPCQALVTE